MMQMQNSTVNKQCMTFAYA